jgi:integrase
MAKRTLNRLSARTVATAKPGFHADGGNLYLAVEEDGRKRWIFRYMRAGRQHDIGFGAAADVPLKDAREQADDARRLLAKRQDPLDARRERERMTQTFGQAADAYIAAHRPNWKNPKHAAQWEMSLRDLAAALRSKDVAAISTEAVVQVLKPIWLATPETASRLRGRIERVLDAARAGGFIPSPWENPARWAGHLKLILGQRQTLTRGHHKALPYPALPDFIEALRKRPANAALALELAILCASRTGEILKARPAEFDLDKVEWLIPPERMKSKRAHRVPLSPRAVEIVTALQLLGGEWLIPGGKPGKPLSDMALLVLLRRMAVDVTPHGFRSTFKDWASECTPFANEVSEMALAHVIADKTESAYRRGDLYEKRKALMTAWAAFCEPKQTDNVVQFRGQA